MTDEEAETLIANNTTSLFVGNVSFRFISLLNITLKVNRFFFFQMNKSILSDEMKLLEQAESERNKLRELLVRHSELEKVERSIVEVRDMFLRISALVIEQVQCETLKLTQVFLL